MRPCRAKQPEQLIALQRQKVSAEPLAGTAWLCTVVRTARAMVWQTGGARMRVGGCAPDLSLYADARMLSDIGLAVDTIRHDPPRGVWPH
jgi:hypothetical protein